MTRQETATGEMGTVCVTMGKRPLKVKSGTTLLQVLQDEGAPVEAVCGGQGKCGKCLVRVNGELCRACRVTAEADMRVELLHDAEGEAGKKAALRDEAICEKEAAPGESFLAAIDLGTTTIAGYLLREKDGALLVTGSCGNSLRRYGADVLSRIAYARKHGMEVLTADLRKSVRELLGEMAHRAGADSAWIRGLSLAGNTCMHHLFLGLSVETLAAAPYTPKVKEAMTLSAADYDLGVSPEAELYIFPNIGGFVGGDTSAGLLAARMWVREEWTLFLDIGTNCEMALGRKGQLAVCSAAAGPAFEGGGICCGMRAEKGAVTHIADIAPWRYEVQGGGKPLGICGSGLLDCAALLLKKGFLDETGMLQAEKLKAAGLSGDGRELTIYEEEARSVSIFQEDIAQLQLAKAAVAAGIRLLAGHFGIEVGEIREILLAGAFGSSLSIKSAAAIGLIPSSLRNRVRTIGNAAGEGAMEVLRDRKSRELLSGESLLCRAEHLELANQPNFQETFIAELFFP